MPNERVRAYLYRVIVAALPILTAYGIVNDTDVPLYVALAAAILSTGLATANTSTRPDA
jgi:4-amino-4-deoxy-L-arabinose transferase-like glycosyltransferase